MKMLALAVWVIFCLSYFPQRDGWADSLRMAFLAPAFVWFIVLVCGGAKGASQYFGALLSLGIAYIGPSSILAWLGMPYLAAAWIIGLTIWISTKGRGAPNDGGIDGNSWSDNGDT